MDCFLWYLVCIISSFITYMCLYLPSLGNTSTTTVSIPNAQHISDPLFFSCPPIRFKVVSMCISDTIATNCRNKERQTVQEYKLKNSSNIDQIVMFVSPKAKGPRQVKSLAFNLNATLHTLHTPITQYLTTPITNHTSVDKQPQYSNREQHNCAHNPTKSEMCWTRYMFATL